MTAAGEAAARRLAPFSRPAELRHATRVAVAVGVSFAVGAGLRLPEAYWIVFTAIIVVQTSVGGTITASLERLAGTIVGGLVGIGAAYLRARTGISEGLAVSLAAAVAAFAAAVRPSLRVAPVTTAIVLLGGATAHMGPITAAAWRVAEIAIGGVIGVATTLVIFPAHAGRAVRARAGQAMRRLGELLDLFAERFDAGGVELEARPAHQAIRKMLAQADQALAEAERESLPGRRAEAPEGLVRSLRRLSSDAIMIGRALASPLPQPVQTEIGPPAAHLLGAMAAELDLLAVALETAKPPPPGELPAARRAFETAVQNARAARLTSAIAFDAAARVFGLVFAMESLLANLADLADRIAELGGQIRPSAAIGSGGREAP